MSTRTRGSDTNSVSSALRLEAASARARAARVRTWATGVHQDDVRNDLVAYAVQLEEKASGLDLEAHRLEASE
jgi:hypothetical protein